MSTHIIPKMCPLCHRPYKGRKKGTFSTFSNTAHYAGIAAPETNSRVVDHYDPPPPVGVFSDAVQFATQFSTITLGTWLTLWLADYPYYWLAPAAGLACSVGLSLAKSVFNHRPQLPQKTDVSLSIDVTERPNRGHKRTIKDAFEGCRPTHLHKLANAHLNQNIPITRRKMKKAGVSQGQFELIRDCLLAGGWADLVGDHDTATAVPNRQGKMVLRAILREFPTLPQG